MIFRTAARTCSTVTVAPLPESFVGVAPPLGAKIRSARFMSTGRAAEFSEHDFGVVLKLPKDVLDPIDTIVELVLSS